ncbi:MAG: zinc ABC transporter substrate-binding protein [Eubacterium sp.]|nr:zinc ABC transporter substrate-binding protein [Eubacterium sp.]
MHKRLIMMLLIAAVMVLGITGCGKKKDSGSNGKIDIVCTIFPEYDWVKEIIKGEEDNFNLTMLMANGADLHNFQPTADDILTISKSDIFIYVGGESDKWVHDALKEAVNKDMIVINLMDVLGDRAKEEELVEGMQGDDEEEEPEYDEHIWLSVKNAEILAEYIEGKISSLDKDEKRVETYKKNLENYKAKLDGLDKQYEEAVKAAGKNTIVFGDRFPFRYLVDDYNIKYYAAFIGCSAETEASFDTITFLAGKVDELSLQTVLTIETSDKQIANTVISNTKDKNQKILTLDSMQAVTAKEADGGKNYYDIMATNLEVLKEALK